jgi:oligopeptide transport system ATP-binding protein
MPWTRGIADVALLELNDFSVRFATPDGEVPAVSELSLSLESGHTLGIVGESGSGKSQTVLGLLGLLAANGRVSGSARFRGQELVGMPEARLNGLRGRHLSMIFQDPMTSLNPYLKVSRQMTEVLVRHAGVGMAEARRRSIEMLDAVRIPEAAARIDLYPHAFSGGMRQRVMIAMALLCRPEVLIADEPTTALDVTVQAQILALLRELGRDLGTAILMITHDLGVVAGLCDEVMVMYAGRVVEKGPVDALFATPWHPYTRGLLSSVPRLEGGENVPLTGIPGNPPDLLDLPAGCPFRERCEFAFDRCANERPRLRATAPGHERACHLDAAPGARA